MEHIYVCKAVEIKLSLSEQNITKQNVLFIKFLFQNTAYKTDKMYSIRNCGNKNPQMLHQVFNYKHAMMSQLVESLENIAAYIYIYRTAYAV